MRRHAPVADDQDMANSKEHKAWVAAKVVFYA